MSSTESTKNIKGNRKIETKKVKKFKPVLRIIKEVDKEKEENKLLGTPDQDHVPRDHADRPAGNQGGKVNSAVAAGVSGLGETQRRESQRELLALQSVWRDRAILRLFGGCTGAVESRISGCICRCVTRVPCPVPPTHSPRPPRLPAGMKDQKASN